LAEFLGHVQGRGHEHSLVLLEALAGLKPEDYQDPARVKTRLNKPPLARLVDDNRAMFVRALAESLGAVRGRERSLVLLEAFFGLDRNADRCAFSHLIRSLNEPRHPFGCRVTALRLVCLVQTILRVLATSDVDLVPCCEAAVDFVESVRDAQMPTLAHVQNFLNEARKLLPTLQQRALDRIAWERDQGDKERAVWLETKS
jgi:hypothetical protein